MTSLTEHVLFALSHFHRPTPMIRKALLRIGKMAEAASGKNVFSSFTEYLRCKKFFQVVDVNDFILKTLLAMFDRITFSYFRQYNRLFFE